MRPMTIEGGNARTFIPCPEYGVVTCGCGEHLARFFPGTELEAEFKCPRCRRASRLWMVFAAPE